VTCGRNDSYPARARNSLIIDGQQWVKGKTRCLAERIPVGWRGKRQMTTMWRLQTADQSMANYWVDERFNQIARV
jgi:hypothetical protein